MLPICPAGSCLATQKEHFRTIEVMVESTLLDTVAWVDSTVIAPAYDHVYPNTIQDPMTLAVASASCA